MPRRIVVFAILLLGTVALSLLGATAMAPSFPVTREVARERSFLVPRLMEAPRPPRRNLFAPLASTVPAAPLRLSAMVGDVRHQAPTAPFTQEEKEHYDQLLARVLGVFPETFSGTIAQLTLHKTLVGSRGLAGSTVMILRTLGMDDAEFAAVAVHELGHIVDMGLHRGSATAGASTFMDGATPVWNDDVSLGFYGISWVTDTQMKASTGPEDFVSGYAMTDPFEDFAESFIAYVLHGERFQRLAQTNTALMGKYTFLKEQVFAGREFRGISSVSPTLLQSYRPWDMTREPYVLAAFLAK